MEVVIFRYMPGTEDSVEDMLKFYLCNSYEPFQSTIYDSKDA